MPAELRSLCVHLLAAAADSPHGTTRNVNCQWPEQWAAPAESARCVFVCVHEGFVQLTGSLLCTMLPKQLFLELSWQHHRRFTLWSIHLAAVQIWAPPCTKSQTSDGTCCMLAVCFNPTSNILIVTGGCNWWINYHVKLYIYIYI